MISMMFSLRDSLAPLCTRHGALAERRLILREVATVGVTAPSVVAPSYKPIFTSLGSN
jgi:hypothetical protein